MTSMMVRFVKKEHINALFSNGTQQFLNYSVMTPQKPKGSRNCLYKKSNIEFTLTKEDVIIPDTCPVFGFALKREDRETWMCAPSIDRIDNTRGYVKDNIIIVSRRANILKKDATINELIKLANYYEHLCHE